MRTTKGRALFDMVIDVLKLKQSGSTSANISFSYTADDDLLAMPGARFKGDVLITGTADVKDKDLYVYITISYIVAGECSRCLGYAEKKVEYSFDAVFSLFPAEDCYLYKSGKADITPAVNEAIVLSRPLVIYCKPDCKGLCPVCGADLNVTDCGHQNNF